MIRIVGKSDEESFVEHVHAVQRVIKAGHVENVLEILMGNTRLDQTSVSGYLRGLYQNLAVCGDHSVLELIL